MEEDYGLGAPSADELKLELEEEVLRQNKINEAKQVQQDEEEQKQLIAEDPRNAENWGLRGLQRRSINSTGGVQDSLSSTATFAERTYDAFSGEMQREKEEKGYYRPEWDPFSDDDDPIITKTWWVNFRGTVHFGTMAAGIVLTAKGLAAAGIPLLGVGSAKLLGLGSVTRAMAIGGISDLVSKESDGMNALGMMRDHMVG